MARIQCCVGTCGVCRKEEQLLLYEKVCGRCLMKWKASRPGAGPSLNLVRLNRVGIDTAAFRCGA